MVRRAGKKSRKMRGSRTHGWGAGKKHRGKGQVGGKGYAWCKHLWVYTLKYNPDHFGKYGFHSIYRDKDITMNVGDLDECADALVEEKLAEMDGEKIKVDLKKLNVTKVLGNGKVTRPFILIAARITDSARKKIEDAGGEVRDVGAQ